MTESESTENLVQRTMTATEFLKLFPWSKFAKFYVIFLIYTVVAGVVFFSTEQCLSDHNAHSKRTTSFTDKLLTGSSETTAEVEDQNCTTTEQYGTGIHENHSDDNNKDDKVIEVKKKCSSTAQPDGGVGNGMADSSSPKCSLKSMSVMKWLYFTVVHFHGAGIVFSFKFFCFHFTIKFFIIFFHFFTIL